MAAAHGWSWCGLMGGLLAACSGPRVPPMTAEAWPEADALFQSDPSWLGADAAYSVDLGGDRVLWLFGDTFVATSDAHVRQESRMVRNTVAVQEGLDPTTASIHFHWRTDEDGGPASFFGESEDAWFWPMHGIVVDGVLLLALVRVVATPGHELGFEVDGWRLVRVPNPEADPSVWQLEWIEPVPHPAVVVPGLAMMRWGEHVVSAALQQPGDHTGHLVRWPADALREGDLGDASWWYGKRGWAPATTALPKVVFADGGTEASLHWDEDLELFVYVRSDGFGASTLVASFAKELTGPWSRPKAFFVPPESSREDAFVYAGKGHPELEGADLVVTYVSNTLADFSVLVDDTSIYYPRFVRLDFGR